MKNITLENIEPESPIMAEEFRRVQTSLEFSLTDKNTICITSSLPNEGKSYIAFHLARTIAESGEKVFLVDADLRNSCLAQKLGYPQKMEGLSHILTGKKSANECFYSTNIEGLFLIPTGVLSSNSTRLFRTPRFSALLEVLNKYADYVIIDTPPIGMVTDAELIANVSGGTVLIVGSNMVHRPVVKESIDRLNIATNNFLGVILNKADSKGGKYGRYGKYGNGYGTYGKKERK